MTDFERYSRDAVHFFGLHVPELLRHAIGEQSPGFALVDVGCGDGHLVYALQHAGLLDHAGRVLGVDVSPIRVERFTANTGYRAYVSDGLHASAIADQSVDLLMNTMVIEHVADDVALVRELGRMLRPGGRLYLTTVLRKKGAWYFRRNREGRWFLDATHVREYPSAEAVENLLESNGYTVEQVHVARLVFPIIHPLLRWINHFVPIAAINKIFLRSRTLARLEKVGLPIPRYRSIEVLAVKR